MFHGVPAGGALVAAAATKVVQAYPRLLWPRGARGTECAPQCRTACLLPIACACVTVLWFRPRDPVPGLECLA